MPAKKATRPTRATRTTKASSKSSSSEAILDENFDTPTSEDAAEVKKKSTKSSAATKKVLEERNDNISSPLKKSSAEVKAESKKSSKTKKSGKSITAEQVKEDQASDSRATTPVPSSPTKKRLPEDQVQAFLQNYDLEAQARLSRLRASLEMSIQSSITRMRLTIERIPRAVRELSLSDFIADYGADIHNFMNRAPVQHLKDTQEEWDQIREDRSPAKAKRSKKDPADTAAKTDRSSKASSRTATAAVAKKKGTRSTRPADRSSSAIPTSPSSRPAPSLATFQPDLPAQTPRPRMARPGEVIQWQSINGSPICGVIGQDGRVVPVAFA
ncbi:hypothetical protein EX895_000619 [Sporisorium graminicola]|uniref:Borealin N-terminal domain-containing protein n=1 Tax=Sporisorium graminicola TaxID=280036 RepID=A0A4U7L089_9BASI|nr:hypothetical protein EX895_000619 [Sporisorium graminicola]TKY90621.1 hypothetical protein EX895_000619 [Sporisorium graminicola]